MLRGPVFLLVLSEWLLSEWLPQNILESKIDLIDFEAASSLQNTSEFLLKTLVVLISMSCSKAQNVSFYYSSMTMQSINKLETTKR